MFSFREVSERRRHNWTSTARLMAAVVSHWKQSTWNLLTHFHHINGWLACRVALALRCQDTGLDVDCGELRSGLVTRQLDHRGFIKNFKEMLCFCCSIGYNLNKSLTFFCMTNGQLHFQMDKRHIHPFLITFKRTKWGKKHQITPVMIHIATALTLVYLSIQEQTSILWKEQPLIVSLLYTW